MEHRSWLASSQAFRKQSFLSQSPSVSPSFAISGGISVISCTVYSPATKYPCSPGQVCCCQNREEKKKKDGFFNDKIRVKTHELTVY